MPHAHACEETFYVVEGEVDVFCQDERTSATAGSAVNVPGWAPHCFLNLSKVPARLFCIVSPAGLERKFLEWDRVSRPALRLLLRQIPKNWPS